MRKNEVTRIVQAARDGNFPLLHSLINDTNVNCRNKEHGQSALHTASSNGHHGCVDFLVSAGADVCLLDSQGNTPLHLAASNCHYTVVQKLVQYKTPLELQNKAGESSMYLIYKCLIPAIVEKCSHSGLCQPMFSSMNLNYSQNFSILSSSDDTPSLSDTLDFNNNGRSSTNNSKTATTSSNFNSNSNSNKNSNTRSNNSNINKFEGSREFSTSMNSSNITEFDTSGLSLTESSGTASTSVGTATTLGSAISLSQLQLLSLPTCIFSLTQLTAMDLSHNRLRRLSDLVCNLTQLTKLNLSFNLLSVLPAKLKNLQNLRNLNIKVNKFRVFPKQILALDKLTHLTISSNQFHILPPTLWQLSKQLVCLKATKCDLKQLQFALPCNISGDDKNKLALAVKTLHLPYNILSHFVDGIFSVVFKNVTALFLRNNLLYKLPEALCKLEHLQKLDVSGNYLTEIPESLVGRSTLEILNITNNKITSLPRLNLLVNLQCLYASRNLLTRLPELGFLKSLVSLDVSNNLLRAIPKSLCMVTTLQFLNIRQNNIVQKPIIKHALQRRNEIEAYLAHLRTAWEKTQPSNCLKLVAVGDKCSNHESISIAQHLFHGKNAYFNQTSKHKWNVFDFQRFGYYKYYLPQVFYSKANVVYMITIELHYLNKTTFTSRLQKWLGSVELAIADETFSYVELESSCDFNLSKTNFKNERTKMRASKSLPQFNSFKEEFSLQSPSIDKPYSIVIVGIKYSSTSHKQQQECEKILQKVINRSSLAEYCTPPIVIDNQYSNSQILATVLENQADSITKRCLVMNYTTEIISCLNTAKLEGQLQAQSSLACFNATNLPSILDVCRVDVPSLVYMHEIGEICLYTNKGDQSSNNQLVCLLPKHILLVLQIITTFEATVLEQRGSIISENICLQIATKVGKNTAEVLQKLCELEICRKIESKIRPKNISGYEFPLLRKSCSLFTIPHEDSKYNINQHTVAIQVAEVSNKLYKSMLVAIQQLFWKITNFALKIYSNGFFITDAQTNCSGYICIVQHCSSSDTAKLGTGRVTQRRIRKVRDKVANQSLIVVLQGEHPLVLMDDIVATMQHLFNTKFKSLCFAIRNICPKCVQVAGCYPVLKTNQVCPNCAASPPSTSASALVSCNYACYMLRLSHTLWLPTSFGKFYSATNSQLTCPAIVTVDQIRNEEWSAFKFQNYSVRVFKIIKTVQADVVFGQEFARIKRLFHDCMRRFTASKLEHSASTPVFLQHHSQKAGRRASHVAASTNVEQASWAVQSIIFIENKHHLADFGQKFHELYLNYLKCDYYGDFNFYSNKFKYSKLLHDSKSQKQWRRWTLKHFQSWPQKVSCNNFVNLVPAWIELSSEDEFYSILQHNCSTFYHTDQSHSKLNVGTSYLYGRGAHFSSHPISSKLKLINDREALSTTFDTPNQELFGATKAILLVYLLLGKTYPVISDNLLVQALCQKCEEGFDSHYVALNSNLQPCREFENHSKTLPTGDVAIVFNKNQILPRYLLLLDK